MMNALKSTLSKLRQKWSWLLTAKVLAGFFVFYLLFSYFAVNPLAKKLVPWVADKSLASVATIERATFDPFRLEATIHGFSLQNQHGDALASFKKLAVDLELSGMFKRAWKLKNIGLDAPQVNFAIKADGAMNWDDLFDKLNEGESAPSNTIPRVMIDQIQVSQGKVQYADASRETPISTTLTPLGFQLKGFSTLPQDRGDYFISAAFAEGGGTLKWKGELGVNPVASKGVVALDGIQIADMLALVEGVTLPIQVNKGNLQTSFNYDFLMPKALVTIALKNIAFALQDVSGEMAQGGALAFNHMSLNAASLDFVKSKQPSLQSKDIELKLTDFSMQQGEAFDIALKESVAQLPQVNLLMGDKPQATFKDLNLKLANIQMKQGQQLTVAVPEVDVNAVSFDLAENIAKIQGVIVSDVSLRKGVADDASKPIATLNQASIAEGVVALDTQQVNVASVNFSGLKTSVIKRADQSINWQDLFNAPPAEASKATVTTEKVAPLEENTEKTKQEAEPAWRLALNKITLDDAAVHIEDASAPTPVVMDIVKANIEVQDASLDMTKPLPVKAAFQVKQGGRFSAKGKLWPAPFKTDLGLRLNSLSLKPFAPYVNQFALLKLNNGSVGVSGKLRVEQQKKLALDFNGGFNVKKLSLIEEEGDAPFLSWDEMKGEGVRFALGPDKLQMKTLAFIQPSGKFIINADKSLNVQRIMRSDQPASPAPVAYAESAIKEAKAGEAPQHSGSLIQPLQPVKTETKKVGQESKKVVAAQTVVAKSDKESFPVTIDRVLLQDAKLEFADLSLITPFGTNIHSLNGVVNGLATQVDKVAQVELDGKVDEYGSARIRGSMQPFQATDFTDIKLAFTNLDMSKLTPYSGKFAGRRIESGKLSVDLGYSIKQQQLVGENKFVVNKIKLGEKVDSEDAADLPLDLAIAILEDSDGVIDLDLPISGSLDDPQFSYSGIVWKAFRNILTKIVTAPFRALGSLFGSGAEEFDGIAFEAGVSDMLPPELEKVAQVSNALAKRKNLSLGIVPSYNAALDTQAIKQAIYRQQVAEEMDVQLAEGQKPGPVDLGNEDAQDAIDTLYNQLTKKGFFKRMASKFEKPEDGHYEKAQAALIESIEVTEDDLLSLAKARGLAIQAALLESGVDESRLRILDEVDASAKDERVKVELTLDVKKAAAMPSDEPQPEAAPVT